MKQIHLPTSNDTLQLGKQIGIMLPESGVVCFSGDLGAGKTTMIKGIASSIAGVSDEKVNSPTFVYLQIYSGKKDVFHFDLYRLQDAEEFIAMGFDEYLYGDTLCLIEWPERISGLLPEDCIWIHLNHDGEGKRVATLKGSIVEKISL